MTKEESAKQRQLYDDFVDKFWLKEHKCMNSETLLVVILAVSFTLINISGLSKLFSESPEKLLNSLIASKSQCGKQDVLFLLSSRNVSFFSLQGGKNH